MHRSTERGWGERELLSLRIVHMGQNNISAVRGLFVRAVLSEQFSHSLTYLTG